MVISPVRKRWGIVSTCIWWTIWKERNQWCFEDKCYYTKAETKCLVLFYFWHKQEYLKDLEYIFDVLESL